MLPNLTPRKNIVAVELLPVTTTGDAGFVIVKAQTEWRAVVFAIGAGVTTVKPGDKVYLGKGRPNTQPWYGRRLAFVQESAIHAVWEEA